MTTPAAEAPAAFENPLIPNARLRQMHVAMQQALMLEKALPARQRASTPGELPHAVSFSGLEACLVAASVDLRSGDLVSDAIAGGALDFLRGTALAELLGASRRRRAITADCGAALRLSSTSDLDERLWIALGAASALAALASSVAAFPAGEKTVKQSGVVLAYARAGPGSAAIWRRILSAAAKNHQPIVFVIMPPARSTDSAAPGGMSALASRCGVPGIAVDSKDAVAIYRVAQESIGRARAGGGPALVECVHFALHPPSRTRQRTPEALDALGDYMLHRKVCTQRWLDDSAREFARHLANSSR